jgi:hypothetical protein
LYFWCCSKFFPSRPGLQCSLLFTGNSSKGLKEFSLYFWLERKWDKYLMKCAMTFFFQSHFNICSSSQLHSNVSPSGQAFIFSSPALKHVPCTLWFWPERNGDTQTGTGHLWSKAGSWSGIVG